MTDKKMKLRATITVDCDAKDFMHAAEIQRDLDNFARELAKKYLGLASSISCRASPRP